MNRVYVTSIFWNRLIKGIRDLGQGCFLRLANLNAAETESEEECGEVD